MLIFCYYINLLEKSHKGKHEGVTYPCDQCDYAATTLSKLKQHTRIKHEGIKYLCDKCVHAATTFGSLKGIKTKSISYFTDSCYFVI